MKKIFLFLNLFLFLEYIQAQKFDDYFENSSLRIDFLLIGNNKEAEAIVTNLKKEPFFAGSIQNLIYPNYGGYRIEVKDSISQNIIYAKGFTPLFKEWQYTYEAKQKKCAFENSIQIPFPKNSIFIEILKRNSEGNFECLLKEKINPNDYNIIKEPPLQFNISIIQKKYPSEKAIDVAIIAEGYTQQEMEKFRTDAKKLIDEMFSYSPFSREWHRSNR